MSNFSHKGYELIVEPDGSKFFKGKCEKIGYEQSGAIISWLHNDFIKFVDRNHTITKHEFIYNDYVLKVTARPCTLAKQSYNLNEERVPDSSNTYCGVCEKIGFKKFLCLSIGTLVNCFKEAVDEHLEPEEKEYEGYVYYIEKPDKDNAWYAGTSLLEGKSWRCESVTKEEIDRAFELEVDTQLDNRRLTSAIKGLEVNINREQRELKQFLEKEGYIITVPVIRGYEYYPLYAIHPQYYDQWRASSRNHEGLPYHAVVFIGENSQLFY